MRKLNRILMGAGALLLSSMAFVSCSDVMDKMDDHTMGATFIQAITAGNDYVDLQWTITPTDKVDGYKIEIYEGTSGNLGSLVTSGTFEKKTYKSTFNGLKPDTHYVVASQCIPAAGSGFNKADVAYFEFWTAPNVTPTSVSCVVTETETEEGDVVYNAAVTVTWMENLNIQQVTNLYIYMADVETDTQVAYLTTPAVGSGTTGTSYTFSAPNIVPGTEYYVEMWPNPSNYCWYTTASVNTGYLEFTMPEAE